VFEIRAKAEAGFENIAQTKILFAIS
jgi:hypothetical protein